MIESEHFTMIPLGKRDVLRSGGNILTVKAVRDTTGEHACFDVRLIDLPVGETSVLAP